MINVFNSDGQKRKIIDELIFLFHLCMGEKNGRVTDESLFSIFSGPQSPCERTDLRMAIVADHLGLSWTGEKHSALLVFSLLVPVYLSFSLWPYQSKNLLFTAIFRLTE